MAIDRLLARNRKHVVWLRLSIPEAAELAFRRRQFQVSTCSDEELEQHAFLEGVGAVIFTQSREKAFQIRRDMERHIDRLLDFDCRVIIQPAPEEVVEQGTRDQPPPNRRSIITNYVTRMRIPAAGLQLTDISTRSHRRQESRSDDPPPHVRIMSDKETWDDVANHIIEHPPGAAPAPTEHLNVVVTDERTGQTTTLAPNRELLLRRAFSDCAEVRLVRMMEGNSKVDVYRAYPKIGTGLLKAKWLLPYFIKVGDRKKIFGEYENYVDAVNGYVPFHLGPHLVQERCCLGARDGIIVGDWVEESESLRDCARNGRAATAIACLFDRTLHGWYRSAELEEQKSVATTLRHRFPRRIAQQRLHDARQLGATKTLEELRKLFLRCDSSPVFIGPIHGDLHASNVRVRATDAIVIDFYSHSGAPLLFDFACLETSLMVEGFQNYPVTDIQEWIDSIQSLYRHPISMAPAHADPHEANCWFHACVRQIRHHAQRVQCDTRQYPGCLALALLLKATKDPRVGEPEASRRAAAYVFAERILSGTFGDQAAADPELQAVA